MREFTIKLGIAADTFDPVIQIVLDGKITGVALEIAAVTNFVKLHGKAAEQAMIDMTMAELKEDANLTEEEYTYYRDNFRELMSKPPGLK